MDTGAAKVIAPRIISTIRLVTGTEHAAELLIVSCGPKMPSLICPCEIATPQRGIHIVLPLPFTFCTMHACGEEGTHIAIGLERSIQLTYRGKQSEVNGLAQRQGCCCTTQETCLIGSRTGTDTCLHPGGRRTSGKPGSASCHQTLSESHPVISQDGLLEDTYLLQLGIHAP